VASRGARRVAAGGRGRLTWMLLPLGAAAAVTGCATVPASGPPQSLSGGSGQLQQYLQPLPPQGPTQRWTAGDVVLGFLHASASFELDPGAARKYLSQGVAWNPDGAPVTVVSPRVSITSKPISALHVTDAYQVTVTGQALASLSTSGQYSYQPATTTAFKFLVAKGSDGVDLIDQLPAGTGLLLTQTDFTEVFQPRNLYFFAKAPLDSSDLVPDPVYAPLQSSGSANVTTLADGLVKGLLKGGGSWLNGATTSAFPAGTGLARVTIGNLTATVDLTGKAVAGASRRQIGRMYDQLWQTLTSSAYSPPVALSVRLEINGRVRRASPSHDVPAAGNPMASLYFASGGVVRQMAAGGASPWSPSAVPGGSELTAAGPITALAASPSPGDQDLAAAVRYGRGCAVLTGPASGSGNYSPVTLSTDSGPCTSLSWDNSGNLWATAGHMIWVIQPGRGPTQVGVPVLPGQSTMDLQVQALRMAPDGVRAALLEQDCLAQKHGACTSYGHMLLLAAVSYHDGGASFGSAVPVGTGVSDPSAIAWSDPYYLDVIAGSGLYEVPLTGGGPAQTPRFLTFPGADSLGVDGGTVAIGTTSGRVYISTGSAGGWQQKFRASLSAPVVLGGPG
jgi:Lipoprotein LpqB beta-propeller domain/Sporulation and spore germination